MARPLSFLGTLAVLGTLALAASSAVANHPQTEHDVTVTFDHVKGNEWWVEVKVTATAPVDSVEARVVGACPGEYTTLSGCGHRLTLNQWGVWAGSFHIPAGKRVEFLAYQNGGMSSVWEAASCPFTHPAGVEQCPSGTSTSTTTGGAFDPPFTGFRGNEWWVQANVGTAQHCVSRVDVRSDNGAWRPLAKQSWGPTAWAASYHFPQGSVLQMRATACDGQVDLSSCRQWIPPSGQDAAIVACPGGSGTTTSTGPRAFDASFSQVKGNEWWAEAVITANAPVYAVLLTNCSTGEEAHDMVHRADWGKWVLGVHIPSGSHVSLTAIGEGGSDPSATYVWPQGTVASQQPCAPA